MRHQTKTFIAASLLGLFLSTAVQADSFRVSIGHGQKYSTKHTHNHNDRRSYRHKQAAYKKYKRRATLRRKIIPCTFGLNNRSRHYGSHHSNRHSSRRGQINGRRISTISFFGAF